MSGRKRVGGGVPSGTGGMPLVNANLAQTKALLERARNAGINPKDFPNAAALQKHMETLEGAAINQQAGIKPEANRPKPSQGQAVSRKDSQLRTAGFSDEEIAGMSDADKTAKIRELANTPGPRRPPAERAATQQAAPAEDPQRGMNFVAASGEANDLDEPPADLMPDVDPDDDMDAVNAQLNQAANQQQANRNQQRGPQQAAKGGAQKANPKPQAGKKPGQKGNPQAAKGAAKPNPKPAPGARARNQNKQQQQPQPQPQNQQQQQQGKTPPEPKPWYETDPIARTAIWAAKMPLTTPALIAGAAYMMSGKREQKNNQPMQQPVMTPEQGKVLLDSIMSPYGGAQQNMAIPADQGQQPMDTIRRAQQQRMTPPAQ